MILPLVMHPTENKGYFSSNRPGEKEVMIFTLLRLLLKMKFRLSFEIQKQRKNYCDEFVVDAYQIRVLDVISLVYTKEVERNQNYQLTIKKKGFSLRILCWYVMYDPKPLIIIT